MNNIGIDQKGLCYLRQENMGYPTQEASLFFLDPLNTFHVFMSQIRYLRYAS